MRFTKAWADVASENLVLKFVIVGLIGATVSLAFALTTYALKEPLLIERSKITKILRPVSAEHTETDITGFLKMTLSQRFHQSEEINENYFAKGEVLNKAKELKEMDSKGVDQKILVNHIEISEGVAEVDADRILMLGNIKSIMPFPLTVKIASVDRSKLNPYGLKTVEVTRVKKKEDKNEK
jgi:hypothetical protein